MTSRPGLQLGRQALPDANALRAASDRCWGRSGSAYERLMMLIEMARRYSTQAATAAKP